MLFNKPFKVLDCSHSLILLLFIVASIVQPVFAETPIKRAKIGLALSGGGARGGAHVGILRILEQNHIPVDYIAGTSMGAVIGGMYATGMNSDQIAVAMDKVDWESVFEDSGPRSDKTFRAKDDERLFLIEQQIGIKDGNIQLPTALVQGQRLELLLRKLTIHASDIKDFDKLPIPFRAIATDIASGEEIILSSGDLSVAIRASMAVPGAFSAVEIDGKLLVDGGISNNLPIDVVRDMGADIIIAVDISTPLLKRNKLNDALAILTQLTRLLTRRNIERQISNLTAQDILIIPELGDLTSSDFKRYNEAITAGKKAATLQLEQLKPLALSASAYTQVTLKHSIVYYQPPVISFININDDSIVDNELIRARLDIKSGDILDTALLDQNISDIYALGNYAHVSYSLIKKQGQTGLEINTTEKPWGSSGIKFGLSISSDLNGESVFNMAAAYTQKPMNGLNGELRTILKVGQDPAFLTEWYQPLDNNESYFFIPTVGYLTQTVNNFAGKNIVSKHHVKRIQLELFGGRNFANLARLRFGYRRSSGSVDLLTGDPTNPLLNVEDFDTGEYNIDFRYDSLNNVSFPTVGSTVVLDYSASRKNIGAEQDVDLAKIQVLGAYPIGQGSIILNAAFNTAFNGDESIQNINQTGGFLNLSGLQQNQLSGQHTGLLLASYMYKLNNSKFLSTYVGASLELGNAWYDSSEIKFSNTVTAGSIYIGAKTPIGPVYFALGSAETGVRSVYLVIGSPWTLN